MLSYLHVIYQSKYAHPTEKDRIAASGRFLILLLLLGIVLAKVLPWTIRPGGENI